MKHMLLLAALVLPPTTTEDDPEAAAARRAQHPWAGWVDGSWVKSEVSNSVSGPMTTTQKLVALGPETYRTHLESTWEQGESERISDHGYGLFGYAHTAPGAVKVGKETLEVAGRELECAVWKVRWTEGGDTFESHAWVAEGIDHPVRLSQKGGPVSLQLEVDDFEDWVTIGRRKLRCLRYAGWTTYKGDRSKVAQWRSSDIPGGHARTVTQVRTPQGIVEHENRVVEFRGEQRR